MRWFGRLFRRRDDVGAVPPAAPKLWAEVALPPPLEDPSWSPVAEPVIEAFAPALAGSRPTVRLGFADGTSLELDNDSVQSKALHEFALRLANGEPAS